MPKHAVRVIQVFRTVRACTIEVEADSMEDALAKVDEGEFDLPSYSDPCWTEEPELQNERTRPATGPDTRTAAQRWDQTTCDVLGSWLRVNNWPAGLSAKLFRDLPPDVQARWEMDSRP